MTINGADKSNSIVADIDFLLWGNSDNFNTAYSLIDRIRNINSMLDEAVTTLYKADPNHKWDDTTNADLPIATEDLIANQDHYTLLDTALIIHRIRMKDPNGVFKTLTSGSRSDFTDEDLNATGTPDKYYKIGGVAFPLPLPNYGQTGGVEIEFQRGGNHFTISDTEKVPGFNSQFHKFLSVGAALEYAIANDMTQKTQTLTQRKTTLQMQMQEHYQLRSPDARPALKLKRRNINSYGI